MTALQWMSGAIPEPCRESSARARARQAQLTKPPGALGEMESVAIRLAGLQRRECPRVDRVQFAIFAADHGVAEEGVSAFPQAVTAQMIDNFASGGAAISVLARHIGATLEVIDLGTVGVSTAASGVRRERIAASTANLAKEAAMTSPQLAAALASGRAAARRASLAGAELFIGGEMGIANTTSATALGCALLGLPAVALAGRGTGLDDAGLAHKIAVIDRALELHGDLHGDAVEALRRLGGFEIAALTASYIASAQLGLPVLVDGFISTVAALVAVRIVPAASLWLLYAHQSAEAGHAKLLQALDARPLLQLGLRLGEGSGAAIALPLLRASCAVHAEMVTFASAGVSAA